MKATGELVISGGAHEWRGGRVAAAAYCLVLSACKAQGLDAHEVVNGLAAVDLCGARVRVVGVSVTNDGQAYSSAYLVMREGMLARARVALRRALSYGRMMRLWEMEARFHAPVKEGDFYPKYSLTRMLLSLVN